MSKRSNRQEDSLEMLLDTMCNAFGGLILIAILIAILARTTGTDDTIDPAIERQKLVNRKLATQAKEVAKAEAKKQSEVGAIDKSVTNLWMNLTNLVEQANTKSNKIVNLSVTPGKIDTAQKGIEKLNIDIKGIEKMIENAKKELKEWAGKEGDAKNNKTIKIRAPLAKAAVRLSPTIVVIQNDRLWPMDIIDRAGGKKLDENHTTVTRKNGTPATQTPKGAGIRIPDNQKAIDASPIGAFCNKIPKKKYLCILYIHANSFKKGQEFKDYLIKKGIKYTWIPFDDPKLIFHFGGTGVAADPLN